MRSDSDGVARAQVPVVPADHGALLASPDPALARNKRLVYDFWHGAFEEVTAGS